MKNKGQLVFGILVSLASLIVTLLATSGIVTIISLICFVLGIILIMRWSAISFMWVCNECGETFEVAFTQAIFSVSIGVLRKNLYCPKCQKKTVCKGIPK